MSQSVHSIDKLKNAHKGRRAFVVARGPSLHGFDFSRLHGELVIAHNESMLFCKATYGFFVDYGVIDRMSKRWPKSKSLKLIYGRRLVGRVPNIQDQQHYIWDQAESFCYGLPTSKNIAGLYTGPVACAYVAWLMGCTEVWMLGMDCYCEDLGNGRVRWYGMGLPERPEIVDFKMGKDQFWFCAPHGHDRYPSYFKRIEGTNHLVHPKHMLFGAGAVEMMKWFQKHVGWKKFKVWNANPDSLAAIPYKELPV